MYFNFWNSIRYINLNPRFPNFHIICLCCKSLYLGTPSIRRNCYLSNGGICFPSIHTWFNQVWIDVLYYRIILLYYIAELNQHPLVFAQNCSIYCFKQKLVSSLDCKGPEPGKIPGLGIWRYGSERGHLTQREVSRDS